MSKLQIDQYSPQGEQKQFSGQKINFKFFRVLTLRKFFKNFSKLRSKFKSFITIFLKKSWNSLLFFIVAYHLQFIGASNGFYRTSITFLVQEKRSAENGQKKNFLTIFSKKPFLTGFYQKSTIIDPSYFLASAMWTRVKSYTLWRKSPKSQKNLSEIMTF